MYPLREVARERPGTTSSDQRGGSRGVPFSEDGVDKEVYFSWAAIPNDNILLLLLKPARSCS